jgi:dihydropteroate synthase
MCIPEQPFSVMGILNVTPDSFYDGGRYSDAEGAIAHAVAMYREGAQLVDVGGASSRPGALDIDIREELQRVVPVVKLLASRFNGTISVDTTSSVVAEKALEAGASWINDISGGRTDPRIVSVAAASGCSIVVMHSRGTPQTMQLCTQYTDVVAEVVDELVQSVRQVKKAGVRDEQIVLDPGIGFAKTTEQNRGILHGIERIVALGYPVLVGTSRKSFIGAITGRSVEDRLHGSLGSIASAFEKGVRYFRVHDVAATVDFLKVMAAVMATGQAAGCESNGR